MWIERIELSGFGNSPSEKVEFAKGSVNLFEETNDQTKCLAPAAVLAALYGDKFESGDLAKLSIKGFRTVNENPAPFLVSLDFVIGNRSLKFQRNLEDNKLIVLDRQNNNADVTAEFSSDNQVSATVFGGTDFKKYMANCLVLNHVPTSESGAKHPVVELVEKITSKGNLLFSQAQAIQVIDDCLSQFPYDQITIKVDFLIAELERQRHEIRSRLENYSVRRHSLVSLITRLRELEPILEGEERQLATQDYFRLCLRAAEIDGTVMQLRSQQIRINSIRRELERIGSVADFTAESQAQIEELWIRRASRIEDYQAIEQELLPKVQGLDQIEARRNERWKGLETFTQEQSQALASMANNLQTNEKELKEFKDKFMQEEMAARSLKLDLDRFELTRRVMLTLDPREIDDAKSFSALMSGYKNQASESERGKERAEALVHEIEGQRQGKGEAGLAFKLFKGNTLRQRELEGAKADLERHEARLVDLKQKITALEQRLDGLALKLGLSSGNALLEELQAYASAPPQLKELDMLQQLIATREASVAQLRSDLEPYYRQAQRDPSEISVESLRQMTNDIVEAVAESKELERGYEHVKSGKEQLDFLVSELTSIEEILAQLFANAGLKNPQNMDESYTGYYANVAAHQHWQTLHDEIVKMQQRYSFEIGNADLGDVISKLEVEKREAWERIQYLANNYPEIAEKSPPNAEQAALLEASLANPEVEMLRNERDRLRAEIRAFYDEYDTNFEATATDLGTVEQRLKQARLNQAALELARERLNALLGEDMIALVQKLEIAKDQNGDALPLLFDSASLPQNELELAVALKFLTTLAAEKQQILLFSNSRKLNLGRFMQPTAFQQQPLKFCLRTSAGADGHLQRA